MNTRKKEAMLKVVKRIEADELAREKWKIDLEIDRLPYWLHPEADYLPSDAGNWPEEYEED